MPCPTFCELPEVGRYGREAPSSAKLAAPPVIVHALKSSRTRHALSRAGNSALGGPGRAVSGVQLAQQKEAGLQPIAFHGPRRDAEGFGDVPLRESAEEPHLDDSSQPFVESGQAVQRLVDSEDVVELQLERRVLVGQRDACVAAAPLRCSPTSRKID